MNTTIEQIAKWTNPAGVCEDCAHGSHSGCAGSEICKCKRCYGIEEEQSR